MSGYNALWVPGMDHAGIATQVIFLSNSVSLFFQKKVITFYFISMKKEFEYVWMRHC